jgi:hypothetical protein
MSREDRRGWAGSVAFHFVLVLVLFLWRMDMMQSEPEFLEVSWGTVSNVPLKPASSSDVSSSGQNQVRAAVPRAQLPVDLPERSPVFDKDDPRLPRLRKSEAPDQPAPGTSTLAENAMSAGGARKGRDEKERFDTGGGTGESATEPGKSVMGGEGVGRSVAWSMQWGDGGTRKLISGRLPEYPEGVHVETQIRIEAIVLPSGRVGSLRPVQKGNTKLETVAMDQVRSWLFEPLAASVPNREQSCLITFNFILR